jgi:6-phosphogluconolactonase
MEIVIGKDPNDVARRAALRLEEQCKRTGAGRFYLALAGGSTPERLYELLAQPPFRDGMPWHALEIFFGDERSVPPDHPDSNYGMAHRALLSKVPVTAHRMVAESGEAEAYERLVRDRVVERRDGVPAFDLILLGMGKDGHTASLFPGTAALSETARLVVMNDVPQMKTRRMTFTYPLINAAKRVWVLVPGADKREKVAECLAALKKPGERPYPVTGVRPSHGELVWWLDERSAADVGS